MTLRPRTAGRLLLPASMATILAVLAWTDSNAAQTPQPPIPPGVVMCPGEAMPVQATGNYTPNTVSDITINGKPAPGAIWSAGHRSYWHCHAGGQIMMLDEGVGRVQKRGEKIEKYKASGDIGEGDGEKAGVAYRMKDGSMVYVPEGGAADQATAPAPSPVNNVGTAPGGMGGR